MSCTVTTNTQQCIAVDRTFFRMYLRYKTSIFLHLHPESLTLIPQNKFQHAHHRNGWWQFHAVGMPYFIGGRETDESQYDGWSNIQAKHAAVDLRSGFRLPSWQNSSQVLQWNGLDEWFPNLESQTCMCRVLTFSWKKKEKKIAPEKAISELLLSIS